MPRVVQQPTLLQVLQQKIDRLVDLESIAFVFAFQFAVLVPFVTVYGAASTWSLSPPQNAKVNRAAPAAMVTNCFPSTR